MILLFMIRSKFEKIVCVILSTFYIKHTLKRVNRIRNVIIRFSNLNFFNRGYIYYVILSTRDITMSFILMLYSCHVSIVGYGKLQGKINFTCKVFNIRYFVTSTLFIFFF